MTATPREMAAWAWKNRAPIVWIVGGLGSAGAAAIGVVFSMWIAVNDHTTKLSAIQEQQKAQIVALAVAREEVVTEQRRATERVEAWQSASLRRDLDMTAQLGSIARSLGKLEGKMDRAAAYQGFRVSPRAENATPSEGMRN